MSSNQYSDNLLTAVVIGFVPAMIAGVVAGSEVLFLVVLLATSWIAHYALNEKDE